MWLLSVLKLQCHLLMMVIYNGMHVVNQLSLTHGLLFALMKVAINESLVALYTYKPPLVPLGLNSYTIALVWLLNSSNMLWYNKKCMRLRITRSGFKVLPLWISLILLSVKTRKGTSLPTPLDCYKNWEEIHPATLLYLKKINIQHSTNFTEKQAKT